MKKISVWILSVVFMLSGCKKESAVAPVNPPSSLSEHYLLGNPSSATTDTANSTNFLLEKKQFVLSYHRTKGIPNWVSWHLDTQWLGSTDRQDDFRVDASLPAAWYRVEIIPDRGLIADTCALLQTERVMWKTTPERS